MVGWREVGEEVGWGGGGEVEGRSDGKGEERGFGWKREGGEEVDGGGG